VGYSGTELEDLNNSPFLARPVLTIGLPWDVALSLAYVPPVEIFGVRPNLLALALERPLLEEGPWNLGLRLHGQVGHSRGAFTCTGRATTFAPGSDGNPLGCEEKSRDTAVQNYVGVELSGSYRVDALGGLEPYVTLGANYLDTEFHVDAFEFGEADHTRLSAHTWTFSLGAGVMYPLSDKTRFSVGVFYVPLWVTRPPQTSEDTDSLVSVRAELSYRLR
jgi:opacity protein-like surface antigen